MPEINFLWACRKEMRAAIFSAVWWSYRNTHFKGIYRLQPGFTVKKMLLYTDDLFKKHFSFSTFGLIPLGVVWPRNRKVSFCVFVLQRTLGQRQNLSTACTSASVPWLWLLCCAYKNRCFCSSERHMKCMGWVGMASVPYSYDSGGWIHAYTCVCVRAHE